ncbi:hypothetical protein ABH999_000901 [Bradyrhizobium yuanmingense]|uniref:hypothetical protein n=1 Tax=Bradyrhizobium yuanmingense TaxID=108015 RepID=UPI003515C5C8
MDEFVQMGAKSLLRCSNFRIARDGKQRLEAKTYEPFHPPKFELLSGINRCASRRPLDHRCGRKLATPVMRASFNDSAISSQQTNGSIMIIAA